MHRRDWKRWQPTSLCDAVDGCLAFALDKHRRTVDRIADLVGESKWTVYKWAATGSIPSRKIPGFEHACGAHYVTAYLAGAAHKLLVDLPTGRVAGPSDINALQAACTAAIGALIDFAAQKTDAATTTESLTAAMTLLAHERAQVERHPQPELHLS